MFQKHLPNNAFLLTDSTCCLAELEQYVNNNVEEFSNNVEELQAWIRANQLIYSGFMQLCLTNTVKIVWWAWRGMEKDFQKWLELFVAVGLTMKNPPLISGIKVTAVYSTDVSDEKQGLLKMKGQDRKLIPACSAPSSLGAD